MSNQEGDFEFCLSKITSIKNLYQDTLIPLTLCDRSYFLEKFLTLRICVNPSVRVELVNSLI